MRVWFIVSLLMLLAGVLLVPAMVYDPGYVLISLGSYMLETSVWVGLAILVVAVVVLLAGLSLLRRLLSSGGAFNRWLTDRGYRRSQHQTTQGLIAFIEGNWQTAQRTLARAAPKSETPLLNYLVAARASHALGDSEQTKHFLKLADQSTSGASIAVGLTQAELQLQSGELEQSLATLKRVRRNASRHPHVLSLLKSVHVGLKDWQEVLALLPELRKYHVEDNSELDQLELLASKKSIGDTSRVRKDKQQVLESLWQQLPKAARKNSEVVAAYVRELMASGDKVRSEKIIRDQLKRDWNKSLVHLYGLVAGEDPNKQLIHAEVWLQERNNDATLLLTLGRLCMRNALWGKAREYFESSRKLESSSEVCAELGRLLAYLGEHEKSNAYFEEGLMLATDTLAELQLPARPLSAASQ